MKIIDVPQTGKLGLTVSYPSRTGLIRRQWVVPANPQSPEQLQVRSRLTQLASGFDALTQQQQDTWNLAAANHQTRATLGQSGPLTGLQLYVKLNSTLLEFGQARADVPPPYPAFPALVPQNLVITNTDGDIKLALTCPAGPAENTILRGSAPQRSGVRRLPGVRVLGTVPAPVAGAADIPGLYTARFGVPAVGSRLFVQLNQFVDGWQSPRVTFTALVPAAA
jgi:hypothetical protein